MNSRTIILERFIRINTEEVLNLVETYETQEIGEFLLSLPPEQSSILVRNMNRFKVARVIDLLDAAHGAQLLANLPPSFVVIILKLVKKGKKKSVLEALPEPLKRSLQQILEYPPDTVGAFIDPNVFSVFENQLIGSVIEIVKTTEQGVYPHIFVISRENRLTGYIELKNLIVGDPDKKIYSITNPKVPKLYAGMDIKGLVEGRIWHESFLELPVVDSSEILLGALTRESLKGVELKRISADRQARQASMALGDLFQIGLSGIFRSATEIIWEKKSKQNDT